MNKLVYEKVVNNEDAEIQKIKSLLNLDCLNLSREIYDLIKKHETTKHEDFVVEIIYPKKDD